MVTRWVPLARLPVGFQPCERLIFFLKAEMPNLDIHKMLGNAWHDFKKTAVGYSSNSLNLSVMAANEPNM
jgi:hypothetical protein